MKKNLLLAAVVFSTLAFSQVGINTADPKTTLDVVASPLAANKADGVLIPKISGDDLRSKNDLYTANQHGALLYVTSADSQPAGKTENVTSPGFYSYDDSLQKWIKLNGSNSAASNWLIQNTTNTATANTDNIYQQGKVAIGFDKDDVVSDYQLDVKGSLNALTSKNGLYHGITTGLKDPSTNEPVASILYSGNNKDFYNSTQAGYVAVVPNAVQLLAGQGLDTPGSPRTTLSLIGGREDTGVIPEFRLNMDRNGVDVNDNYGASVYTTNPNGSNNIPGQVLALSSYNRRGNGNNNRESIVSLGDNGVAFSFQDTSSLNNYIFPSTVGALGQVLVVDNIDLQGVGSGFQTTTNQLAWKNPSNNNWLIQNTENTATTNTDDIYQKGKVAIGFDKDDVVSDYQLDVKGSFATEVEDSAKGEFAGIISDNVGGQLANISYVSDKSRVSGISSGQKNSGRINNIEYIGDGVIDTTDPDNAIDAITSTSIGTTYSRFLSRGSIRGSAYELKKDYRIEASSYGINFSHTDEDKITKIESVGGKGITFSFDDDNTGLRSYTFPTDRGIPGQVLAVDQDRPGYSGSAYLSWKSLSDIAQSQVVLKSPNGSCFKITVNDAGVLVSQAIACQ